MKKILFMAMFSFVCAATTLSHAKLSDTASMKCISQDKGTRSALWDLEQAYEMRSISAKNFFRAFDKAETCQQLRKNLHKLHGEMISRLPTPVPKAPNFEALSPNTESVESAAPAASSVADESNSTFFE